MPLPRWLERLRAKVNPKGSPVDTEALEALRREHNARCVAFKLLISANNQALEVMSDMEMAQQGDRLFGMHYIRSQTARALTSVHQIIKQFQDLGGPCPELFERYAAIAETIHSELDVPLRTETGPLLLHLEDVRQEHFDMVGPKVASLAHAARALGLHIPEGFVLTARSSAAFLATDDLATRIEAQLHGADVNRPDALFTVSSAIQQAILKTPLPDDVQARLEGAAWKVEAQLGSPIRWAVRSSALGEDLQETSFAGQYHTVLNAPTEELAESVKQVVASKYGVTALSYRLARGVADEDAQMCVACMRMIDAACGGVVYTQDPLGDRPDAMVVTAAPGLPKTVVDGEDRSDVYLVDRKSIQPVARTIEKKRFKLVNDPEAGLRRVPLTKHEGDSPTLDDDALARVAETALQLEAFFGAPQDVEFAFDQDGAFYILQSRPLQVAEKTNEGAESQTPTDATTLLRGGVTASPGAAWGEVYILRKDIDAVRCPDRAVAVALQASPRWATLLHRVAALVTEQGSAAGHLGNVAREFKIPAIFGMEGCVERLEGVGTVTVDADNRAVYEGMVYTLLENRPRPPRLMLGSTIHTRLEQVLRHIAPLTLLDPQAPEFAPAHVRTLHDITRYCHEKAVAAMFSANQDHTGLHRLSKQLFHKVPMQYWIVDLGGGATGEDRGKFILVEDILSEPMLAVWNGMTAKPMETPPVDAKGFMSVLMEAAVNPELEAAAETSFTMRNYFMISREFCNLQSRFGFHFCTLEAAMGNEAAENYAAFQFKGGAADLRRRILRAEMVRDILQEYDFRTEVKQDALFARVEDMAKPALEIRLKVLGFLIIHTRQLDMAMTGPAAATAQKNSLLEDLRTMLDRPSEP